MSSWRARVRYAAFVRFVKKCVDLVVLDLREVVVELADGVEVIRPREADQLVDLALEQGCRLRCAGRHREDDPLGSALAERARGGDRRRPRRPTVVGDDRDASFNGLGGPTLAEALL